MFGFLKRRRRRRLRESPFPEAWRRIVERRVPLWRRLPEEDRRELEGHVQVFLAEKPFEGAGGLVMRDEIRVTIAAQACVLLLHRDIDYFPGLYAIVVYPTGFVVPMREEEGGIVSEGLDDRLGESWTTGAIVLSWDDVRHGVADAGDGENLVLHEFAHQLDDEAGGVDGLPRLERGADGARWARVMRAEFERLRAEADRGEDTLLDPYGAETPAEFFAVATEYFFERGAELESLHPALYEEMRRFYKQDPARWGEARGTGRRDALDDILS
ncbi:MAG TPA: M90 family metallopeptidase [Gemmatimonadaceae bacterium]|nr:M90 family metallopeptidase [Gemmatimonadaceae bacterium]